MNLASGDALPSPCPSNARPKPPFGYSMWNDVPKTEKDGSSDNVQVLSPEPHLQVTGFHPRPGAPGSKKKGRTNLLVLPIRGGSSKESFVGRSGCRLLIQFALQLQELFKL